jgi:hypothetical protein
MRNTWSTLLLGALALCSAQARAQDADTTADVRCVIVGTRLLQQPGATEQSAGAMLTMYYIGRLDGRVPKLDLEEALIKEASIMTGSDYAAEAKRCGASLTAKGQEITRIGKDMVEKGQKTSGEQAK